MKNKKQDLSKIGETKHFYYTIGLNTQEISLSYLNNDKFELDIFCGGNRYVQRYKTVSSIKKYLKEYFSLNDEQIEIISTTALELKRWAYVSRKIAGCKID